jgi:outer membrane immunogenic protein
VIRHALLASTALVSLSGLAFAADLPSRAAPLPMFAPAPIFSWTGFYIGATVGGVSLSTTSTEACDGCSPLTSQNNLGGGVIAGGTLGYNYQTGQLVLGLEGDFSYAGAQSNFTDDFHRIFGKSQLTDLGTARVRLGYTPWDRTLLYVTGGLAWGDLKNALGEDYPVPGYSQSTRKTATGWTIGGGLEQAITDHITVKAEALYVDLGKTKGCDGYCGCRTSFKNTAVVGRVGLNVKF